MDEVPIVDFSSLTWSVDGEELNECDLKAAGEQFMNAFNTFDAVHLYNTGLNYELVRRQAGRRLDSALSANVVAVATRVGPQHFAWFH